MCKFDIYKFRFEGLNWEKNERRANTDMVAMTEWFYVNSVLTERYTQRAQWY